MQLRYGVNPHQAFARAEAIGDRSPIKLLSGTPSYVNVLDALNAWRLVREAGMLLGKPAAASLKHVSPAGAAVAGPLDEATRGFYGFGNLGDLEETPPVQAYVRARDADPKSSFGDFAALSEPVDAETAAFLQGVVSDGIVAPGYETGVVGKLSAKKRGQFLVVEADPSFEPPPTEARELFGMRLEQDAGHTPVPPVTPDQVVCGDLPERAAEDLLLGQVAVKYTQSNAVGYVLGGQMIGIGAGQQSRVDCTKLAGAKVDLWFLRRHPKVMALPFREEVKRQDRINWCVRYIEGDLTPLEQDALAAALETPVEPLGAEDKREWLATLDGVSFVSDGFIPFRDNVDHARRHGVRFIAEPGGSIREQEIEDACRQHGITLVRTGLRLFHH